MWHTRPDETRSTVPARTLFVLLGAVWAMRSLQSFTEPNFTDPESAADWWAVISVSLGLALLSAGIVVLVGSVQHGNRFSGVFSVLAALGAVTAATANLIEDGLGVKAAGSVYYGSILVVLVTMLALAGVLITRPPYWPGAVVVATLIGLVLLEAGGGFLILFGWGAAAFALRPRSRT
jgi:hypothetical protein